MKIALVQAPYGYRGREAPPFSVVCLAGYVRAHGHRPLSVDLNNGLYHAAPPELKKRWDADQYSFWENRDAVERLFKDAELTVDTQVRRILESGARLVGFATHTTSFLASLAMAERLKREDPSIQIVFGGYQAAREKCAFDFIKDPRVDGVAVGEGEATLVEALDALQRGESRLPAIPGLLVKDAKGKVVDSGDREPIADFDAFPFPDYSDFKNEIVAGLYSDPHRLDVLDGRSCVRRCAFCNEWQYWGKFRSRSGARILEEIRHQLKAHPTVDHFYFTGLLLNGNLRELSNFCDLALDSGLKFTWGGQAIVQPGMTKPMLDKMAAAGCRWLGYGVESGSEAVRFRINKKFSNENAYSTLKATKEAGIKAQINVMFGMPSETRDEHRETLAFLTRVRPYLDSVLASQSFAVIDKDTPLHREPEKWGVTNADHHLFWESNGGENDYAERFRRYEEFCRLALYLGVQETSGVLRVKPDKWSLLGQYYEYKKSWTKAVLCYRRSLKRELVAAATLSALARCYKELGRYEKARVYEKKEAELASLSAETVMDNSPAAPAKPKFSQRAMNVALNDAEFKSMKQKLFSTPKFVTLGTHNACNAKCVFCLEGKYDRFTLAQYKEFFEKRMGAYIKGAEKVTFTGFGELLWVPGIEEILDYLNETIPETEKIFTTNGTPLTPSVVERLLKSRYVIQVSLHASHAKLHEELTLLKNGFDDVISKVRSLTTLRDQRGLGRRLHVELVNILVNRNLSDLPALLDLAWDLKVQGVRNQYVTIFAPDHIAMSPYFNQKAANEAVLAGRAKLAQLQAREKDRPFHVQLPPLFGAGGAGTSICYDPWQHVYVELQGSVIPCCLWGEHVGDLKKGDELDKVWNNAFYKELRRGMAEGDPHPWCKSCVRYSGFNVDSLLCHLTNRPETQRLLLKEIERRGLLPEREKAPA
jgi:radical SAM superfamily enzyme YgiQ (UPF0313 family)/molybdenum cofactor biosynthesis enzyme MoaA